MPTHAEIIERLVAAAEAAEAERDRLQGVLAATDREMEKWIASCTDAEAERDRLRELVREAECELSNPYRHDMYECTEDGCLCTLQDLLARLREAVEGQG